MDYKDFNDYELLYMVSDNEDAMDIILKKYEPIIENMSFSYIREFYLLRLDVDDLIQEGRLAVALAINSFSIDKNVLFYTYVILCIRRAMLHYIRKCSSGKNSLLDFAISIDDTENDVINNYSSSVLEEPMNYLQESELYMDIMRFKCDLNHDDASILSLKIASFSYKEISLLLDISRNVVAKRLEAIRKKLKKYLLNLSYDL